MLVGIDASRVTRPRRTGTENYSLQVLREILVADGGLDLRLYVSEEPTPGLLPTSQRVQQRVIRMPRLWTHVGLSREMFQDPPDVLFVPSHVLPIVRPQRCVVVVYDVGHRLFPRAHRVTEWLYLEWSIRRHVRVAREVITISEASKSDLIRLYHADPRRVTVACPAVDESFRPVSSAEISAVQARHRLPADYMLHVGTVKPRKNLPRLVRAFATANLPTSTYLVLAGQVSFGDAALRRAIDETGTASRVRLLPYVPSEDLPALYAGAKCVAVVSLHEGFGMPALEALACGAPLVVSNRGSLPEVVGAAAVLADPLDLGSIRAGIERVFHEPGLAGALRAEGPARARQFTWADAARVTVDAIYRAGGP